MNRLRVLAFTMLMGLSSAATGAEGVDYVREVKPILSKRCYACHVGLRQRAGLRLDTAALIRKGGKGGSVIVEGRGEESGLLDRVLAMDSTRMPPEGEGEALKADEVAVLKAWIDAGALGREAETPQADPRGHWPRRMESEVVRDSILHLSGALDPTGGGPDLDPLLAETVPRRSVYFRHTPDDIPMFLLVFDAPNPVECYRHEESIIPQQALALANGGLAQDQARVLARNLVRPIGGYGPDADAAFVIAAFEQVLGRSPTPSEARRAGQFLREQASLFADRQALSAFPSGSKALVSPASNPTLRAWENLVHVLFNHNDFVTLR